MFYSVLFLILFLILDKGVSKGELLYSIFPVITKQNYWFVTCYLFMYIISPFLNVMLSNINKKQHFFLCSFFFFVFCILNTILPSELLLDGSGGYGIIWFCVIYVFAVYIKKYCNNQSKRKIIYFLIYVISCLCILLSYIFFSHFNLLFYSKFYNYNSMFVFISSLSLFMFFKNITFKNNTLKKLVSFLAPLTFGVYLIHENIFLRQILYNGIFNSKNYIDYVIIYPLIVFIQALFILVICSLLEYIRINLFKKLEKNSIIEKFKNICLNFINYCCNLINKFIFTK